MGGGDSGGFSGTTAQAAAPLRAGCNAAHAAATFRSGASSSSSSSSSASLTTSSFTATSASVAFKAPLSRPPSSHAQIVGFFHGYAERDFVVTFYWWLGASLLAGVLTIPSWPCLYQRHKVVWADQEEEVEPPAPTHAAPARSQGGGGGKRR